MDRNNRLKILKQLVNIKTVASNEGEVAKYLSKLFNQYGVKNKLIPQFDGRDNLVAQIGHHKGPKLAFAGHEDTVHEGNLNKWEFNPFEATIKDNRLYGRGVTDMKAGLAAMVVALIELHTENQTLHGTLRFLATISEELTQGGANHLAKLGYVDDLDAVILGEPTGLGIEQNNQHYLVNAHKGALIYTVESFGKAAHSSTPEKGIDAIENLINYRNTEKQLFKGFTERDKELGSTIYTPDIFRGGQQVNSIPDYAYQQVMVRTIPQLSNEKIIDKIKNLVNKLNHSGHQNNFKLKVNFSGNPVKTDKNSEIIKVSRETFNKVTGENLPIKSLSMGTDASQFTNRNSKLSAIVFGPGNNTAHQTNEYIDLPSYFNFIEVYKKIAIKYLS